MSSVGLLYVGAVLFINGLMLIGVIPGKSAAILNFFVGGMQVIFPTVIILQTPDDPAVVFGAAGLYLFGFTYLYVGILQLTGIDGDGLGWFSLFVAVCAVVVAIAQFVIVGDPVFGVIWLVWAVLWFLFFLVLGLHVDTLTVATGWFTIVISHLTGTIPAFFLLLGFYRPDMFWAIVIAVVAVVAFFVSLALGQRAVRKPEQPSQTKGESVAAV